MNTEVPTYSGNILIRRIKKYPVISFTIGFLAIYRFVLGLLLNLIIGRRVVETYNVDIRLFLLIIPIAYGLQWLIVTWIASKYTTQTLKQKIYRHPIAVITFSIIYIYDLPYRLSNPALGSGIAKIINSFEIIIYYAFLNFLLLIVVSWISERVWKKQQYNWNFYKGIIDKLFVILPPTYKISLGLITALFIFMVILLISWFLGYSGSDLEILGL